MSLELCRDCLLRHMTTPFTSFPKNTSPSGVNLCDGEHNVDELRQEILETRKVGPDDIRTTLDHTGGQELTSRFLTLVFSPTVVPSSGPP